MKELYCVINTSGEIIGRFINENRANNYMIEYSNNYNEKVNIKRMTTEEYLIYTRKLIDEILDK